MNATSYLCCIKNGFQFLFLLYFARVNYTLFIFYLQIFNFLITNSIDFIFSNVSLLFMRYLDFNEKEFSLELKEQSLLEIKNVCSQCKNCPLWENRTNIVFSDGKANAPVMLIGEAHI